MNPASKKEKKLHPISFQPHPPRFRASNAHFKENFPVDSPFWLSLSHTAGRFGEPSEMAASASLLARLPLLPMVGMKQVTTTSFTQGEREKFTFRNWTQFLPKKVVQLWNLTSGSSNSGFSLNNQIWRRTHIQCPQLKETFIQVKLCHSSAPSARFNMSIRTPKQNTVPVWSGEGHPVKAISSRSQVGVGSVKGRK